MTHDEIRLSLPAFALGALDSDEHAEVAAHVATCAECAAALVEEERVVANIGLEATPVTPPIALKSRVLARIAAEPRDTNLDSRTVPFRAPDRARSAWAGGLLMAASVAIAIGASLYAYALRSEVMALRGAVAAASDQSARLRQELATMRRDWATLTRAMDVMKAPDLLRVDLKGQTQAPGATGRALWSQGAGLVFTAERLPALPAGRVYQLWAIAGTTPTGSGVFVPDAAGGASVTVPVPAGMPRPDAFGVTIEPTGGSATPTMPIVLLGSAGR
jgi:anti-sigma-K factor RskA